MLFEAEVCCIFKFHRIRWNYSLDYYIAPGDHKTQLCYRQEAGFEEFIDFHLNDLN